MMWFYSILKSFSLVYNNQFHDWSLTIKCDHFHRVLSLNAIKLKLPVTLDKFFFFLTSWERRQTYEVKSHLKLILKVDSLFHKVGHISLISSSNYAKLELQVTFEKFFLHLIEIVGKQGQIVLKAGFVKTQIPTFEALFQPCLSISPIKQEKKGSRVIRSFDFIAFELKMRKICPNA